LCFFFFKEYLGGVMSYLMWILYTVNKYTYQIIALLH